MKHLLIMQVLVMQQEKSIKQGVSWVYHHSISHDSILGKQPMVGSILRADIVLGVGGELVRTFFNKYIKFTKSLETAPKVFKKCNGFVFEQNPHSPLC